MHLTTAPLCGMGGRSAALRPKLWNGPTGRVPCSVMTVRTPAPRSSRTRRMKTLTAWCTTDTLGALRPLDWATTGQSRVDHAIVPLEKHRHTRVGFFVTTGLLTNMSCALRAVWARSSPVQAPALRISVPSAAAASMPASTEPRAATRAHQVASKRRMGQAIVCHVRRVTSAHTRVLRFVRFVPLVASQRRMGLAIVRLVAQVTSAQTRVLRSVICVPLGTGVSRMAPHARLVDLVTSRPGVRGLANNAPQDNSVPQTTARRAWTAASAALQMVREWRTATVATR